MRIASRSWAKVARQNGVAPFKSIPIFVSWNSQYQTWVLSRLFGSAPASKSAASTSRYSVSWLSWSRC